MSGVGQGPGGRAVIARTLLGGDQHSTDGRRVPGHISTAPLGHVDGEPSLSGVLPAAFASTARGDTTEEDPDSAVVCGRYAAYPGAVDVAR